MLTAMRHEIVVPRSDSAHTKAVCDGTLVAAVDDPKFDERSAHQILAQLVEQGRVERQRGANGDEYWSI